MTRKYERKNQPAPPRKYDVTGTLHRLQQRVDVVLDYNVAGWRLTTRDGSRDLSPRLRARDICQFMEAFMAGMDVAYRAKTVEFTDHVIGPDPRD